MIFIHTNHGVLCMISALKLVFRETAFKEKLTKQNTILNKHGDHKNTKI